MNKEKFIDEHCKLCGSQRCYQEDEDIERCMMEVEEEQLKEKYQIKPEERLGKGILKLAYELGMDHLKTLKDIQSMPKDQLIDTFIDLKTLIIAKENRRIIDLLLSE